MLLWRYSRCYHPACVGRQTETETADQQVVVVERASVAAEDVGQTEIRGEAETAVQVAVA